MKTIIMKQTALIVMLFILSAGFISCEGNTTYEWKITNDGSSSVFLKLDSSFVDLVQDTIQSGETKTIIIFDKLGGSSNSGDAVQWQNLLIYKLTDTLEKNANLEMNWTVYSEQRHKIPSDYYHEFKFDFNDSDF